MYYRDTEMMDKTSEDVYLKAIDREERQYIDFPTCQWLDELCPTYGKYWTSILEPDFYKDYTHGNVLSTVVDKMRLAYTTRIIRQ